MARSILENPKLKEKVSLQLGVKEGILTSIWRQRLIRFYKSIIPSHIEKARQIWLIAPEEMAEFAEKIKSRHFDLSNIEYVCIVETIADIYDIVEFFSNLKGKLPDHAKIFCTTFSWIWAPVFRISGLLGLSRNRPFGNVYRKKDLRCFLEMSGWDIVKRIQRFLLPFKVPVLTTIFDSILVRLPFIKYFSLNTIFILRKSSEGTIKNKSVTVLIPCKNEEDNIEAAINRMPTFGQSIEMIFINDKSTDRTQEIIKQCQKQYFYKNIVLVQGKGKGKGEAVREGMRHATGEICMILDADLTVIPEDLPQFYEAINARRADFIHGTRMVYPQENDSMRFANILGNIFFSKVFSFILGQRTTDTLCGTKVFWRRDWPIFEETRQILRNSDLWGDYNLIFGASRYGLKISQLPVRYFERLQGITKMNKRIRNGLIMLKVAWHALWKIKFDD